MKVWLNGSITDAEAARVPVTDRGLLYGDALFETFRTYSGVPFRLEGHLARLASSGQLFNLKLPLTAGEVRAIVGQLLSANRLTDAVVRLTVTRGTLEGPLGLDEPQSPNVFITLREPAYPPELYRRGMKLVTATVRRNSLSPLSRHKTANYLDALLARREARSAGADEALMLDEAGNVAECTTANVFAVRDDVVLTPPLGAPILPGVTRAVVLELCQRLSIKTRQEPCAPDLLRGASEVFITNSVLELAPVTTLDGKPVGTGAPGAVSLGLREAYREQVRRECKKL